LIAGDPGEAERLALEALQIGNDGGITDVTVHRAQTKGGVSQDAESTMTGARR